MVLIACEESQRVTIAFRDLGIEAYSCDLLEPSGGHPEWHFQCDVREILYKDWVAVLAFPPCNDLAISGARWFKQKRKDGRQQAAIDFFMLFANHPARYTVVENSIGIMSTEYRKPDQIVRPWQHGEPYAKSTCLWLKNLPLLQPTNLLEKNGRWLNQTPTGNNKVGEQKNRSRIRSKTYQGVAQAMAAQWAPIINES